MSKRVMLKLSGEMFQAADGQAGIDFERLHEVAKRIAEFKKKNDVELLVTVGAGNLWRYRDSEGSGIDRVTADKMGIHATMMNAVALQSALQGQGQDALALSAVSAPQLVAEYDVEYANQMLEHDTIVICAGGTGNPYFTTDSAAVLRAIETNCDLLLKGTKVDGVYSADPEKDPKATRYDKLTYEEVLAQKLRVMDLTAFALAMENDLPILVFDFADPQTFATILDNQAQGTYVSA